MNSINIVKHDRDFDIKWEGKGIQVSKECYAYGEGQSPIDVITTDIQIKTVNGIPFSSLNQNSQNIVEEWLYKELEENNKYESD